MFVSRQRNKVPARYFRKNRNPDPKHRHGEDGGGHGGHGDHGGHGSHGRKEHGAHRYVGVDLNRNWARQDVAEHFHTLELESGAQTRTGSLSSLRSALSAFCSWGS